eukprot:jgi/Psemu1/299253/fgenesh1_pm.1098_\
MAAFLSFSQRNNPTDGADEIRPQPSVDSWNLGMATSTSTVESTAQHSTGDETMRSVNTPPTPEGLRPRKSIQRIRNDIFGSDHYYRNNELVSRHHKLQRPTTASKMGPLPPPQHIHCHPSTAPVQSSGPVFPVSASPFRQQPVLGPLPSSFHQNSRSSISSSSSSFYEQSVEESDNVNSDEFEMDSSLDYSFSRRSRRQLRPQQVATSPDFKRGGKAKTAVGALLLAMAETSTGPESKPATMGKNPFSSGIPNDKSRHSILPPRTWMGSHPMEDEYLGNRGFVEEDDTIRDDLNQHTGYNGDDNDNQSSLHASPSSLRRKAHISSWAHRRAQLQNENDTSFTRRILDDGPSSSRFEDRSILVDNSPYNFNSIMTEEISGEPEREIVGAPRVLSLIKDHDGLDLSAISHSHHQNGINSVNTSLADTMEDEEDEYREIPKYYQAVVDEFPVHNTVDDGALLLAKAQNQRQRKENLLRSTFQRLQNSMDVLKELYSQSTVDNSMFLGMGKEGVARVYRCLESALPISEEIDSSAARKGAITFFMSVLENTEGFSICTNGQSSKYYIPGSTLSEPRWIPVPGFRSSLGLEEEPQSPPSIARGGDTSLFSLPSDSANDTTPHTSNVSITSTLTTIVSPEKYESDRNKVKLSSRKTIESLARLLHGLEASCVCLDSGTTTAEKSMVIKNIQCIYLDLINLPAVDLEQILDQFQMNYARQLALVRTVSRDQGNTLPLLFPPHRNVYESDKNAIQESIPLTRNNLRVSISHCNDDDANDDNQNQSIECDLWSPTTNDMRSLISPGSTEANMPATSAGYAPLVDTSTTVDDLRRTSGSFDRESVEDERQGSPSWDENEDPDDHRGSFPATFARRVVAQSSKRNRFWKKRFLALKNRGRQATAE